MSTPPSNDSDLRSLFDDAVSDVHPRGGTSEIRARAGRPVRGPLGAAHCCCCRGGCGGDRGRGVAGPATVRQRACSRTGEHRTGTNQPAVLGRSAQARCARLLRGQHGRGAAPVRRDAPGHGRVGHRAAGGGAGGPDRVTARPRLREPPQRAGRHRNRCRQGWPGHGRPVRTALQATRHERGGGPAGGAVARLDGGRGCARQRTGLVHRRRRTCDRGARHRHVRTGGARQC